MFVGQAEKQVGRKGDSVAQLAAKQDVDWNIKRLADNIETGEFNRRQQLCAIVVEACGRVGDFETQRLKLKNVMTGKIIFKRLESLLDGLAAAAHFAKSSDAGVGVDFDDCAYESAPMRTARVAQRRFQRNRDCRRTDCGDANRFVHGDHVGFA